MAFCNGLQVRRTLGYHEGRAARLQSTQDIIEYQIVARFIINQLLENILNGRSRSAQCGLELAVLPNAVVAASTPVSCGNRAVIAVS